jgi:hypothetical protein
MMTMIYNTGGMSCRILLSLILLFVIITSLNCVSDSTTGIGTPVLISPQDGSAIAQNPPLFVWRSVDSAVIYSLQVTDGSFDNYEDIVINATCNLDTTYLPSMALGTGSYLWRVQAVEEG